MSADVILSRLAGVRQVGGAAWFAKCPAHKDGSPSLSIRESREGKILVKCFAGCETSDVLAAVELDWKALFPEELSWSRLSRAQFSALELLGIIDDEVTEAAIILADIVKRRKCKAEDATRLAQIAGRIGRVRDSARRAAAT